MAGTEVMIGVGARMKDSLPMEEVPEHLKTPEKAPEKGQSGNGHPNPEDKEKEKALTRGAPPSDSPGKNKGGTPKKNEMRNVFSGPRQSPKKNPWTRNAHSEGGGKEGGRKEGTTAAVPAGKEESGDGKGIEIPKGEVRLLCSVCV